MHYSTLHVDIRRCRVVCTLGPCAFQVQVPQNTHDGNVDFRWQRGCVFTNKDRGPYVPRPHAVFGCAKQAPLIPHSACKPLRTYITLVRRVRRRAYGPSVPGAGSRPKTCTTCSRACASSGARPRSSSRARSLETVAHVMCHTPALCLPSLRKHVAAAPSMRPAHVRSATGPTWSHAHATWLCGSGMGPPPMTQFRP